MYHYSALNANPNYCFSEIYPFGHMAYTFGQHVPCAVRRLRFVHARMFRWWFHPYIATKVALRRITMQTALHRQHLCRSQCVVRYAHRRSHLRLIFNMMKCAMRYAETSVYLCQHVPAASPIHSKKRGAYLQLITIQAALHRQHFCRSQYAVRDAYRISFPIQSSI